MRATAEGDEWTFEPAEGDVPWQIEVLRAPENVRRVEEDLSSGIVSLIIEDDFGKRRDLGHGLIAGGKSRERWEIHPDDPLKARGITHWTEEMERGDIRLRTETYAEMWADATHFHLTGRLEAYEGDVLVLERDVAERIARDGVLGGRGAAKPLHCRHGKRCICRCRGGPRCLWGQFLEEMP